MIKHLFPPSFFDYQFAIVRHPLDRFFSEYRHYASRCLNFKKPVVEFNEWAASVFEEYKSNPYLRDNHIRPQWEFVGPKTRVYKYEEGLDKVMRSVLEDAGVLGGVELSAPAKKNVSKNINIDISPLVKEELYSFYKKDFQYFLYD